jgi:hypothetical protein
MTRREKMLAGAVAGTAVLWGAMRGVERYRVAVARNEDAARIAANSLDDAEFAVQRGERAKRRLIAWGDRSLPSDPDVAKSLYQDWVRTTLAGAGLKEVQVTDKTFNRRNPNYSEISLEAKGSGKMEELVAFLYKFYAAPHLHRISAATVVPSENGEKLAIALTIDALTLPDSKRTNQLAKGDEQKLPQSQDAFRASLAGRNLFKPHTPGADPNAGLAGGARFSGISNGESGYILWITTETPAKTRRYKIGDKLEYGSFTGKLVELDRRRAVFETASGRVEVLLDHTLGEAKPVEEKNT